MPKKTNTCTALIPFMDSLDRMSVEMKTALQTHQALEVGACDYCGNPAPKERYSGCPIHKACEVCHADASQLRRRHGGGLCAAGKCKEKAAAMPLVRDLRLEEHEATLGKFHEQIGDALTREVANVETLKTTLEATKEELRKLRAAVAAPAAAEEETLVVETQVQEEETLVVEPETQVVQEVETEEPVVEPPVVVAEVENTTAPPVVEELVQASPPPKRKKPKRKADFTPEEWEAQKEAKRARELKRAASQVGQELEELRKENQELRAVTQAQQALLVDILGGVEPYEERLEEQRQAMEA